MKKIILLGSTGSIGTQTLDIIRLHPDKYQVTALTANNSFETLIALAREFLPKFVVIANETYYENVRSALHGLEIEVMAGTDALNNIVQFADADIVVTAMVGFSGLIPTLNAIKSGKNIALANKETLVVAGELIMEAAQRHDVKILPVDSEHSAIFQSLVGEDHSSIENIILTASGGPFRNFTYEQLELVTPDLALKHPNWDMGAKITIDSATLMNKGLELIEARWLFNVDPSNIEVVIHPQSIIHSMVQFVDGSIKAQMGLPDMRFPIQYALSYPTRHTNNLARYTFSPIDTLTFDKPDLKKFPCLQIAIDALNTGGTMPCIINAANEIAVEAFLKHKIQFTQISTVITQTAEKTKHITKPTLQDYLDTNTESRTIAQEIIKNIKQK